MLMLMVIVGLSLHLGMLYYAGILLALGFALYQQWLIRSDDVQAYFAAFLNNHWLGAVLFVGTLLG
jgi:4-hydroxybenzoate polyprenyltransferase